MPPIAALLAALACAAFAQEASTRAVEVPITVEGSAREASSLGSGEAATRGSVGGQEVLERPILRQGEVLETVPGVIITQHSGPGKANQYFLRGFNLDHGTDFATSLEGMPLNLPSHAHGQGYTDLNFIIPELLRGVDYRKGPYYADVGDFGSAGAADLRYVSAADRRLDVAYGSFGYARGLFTGSSELAGGSLLYAAEASHEDGPWTRPDDYQKANGVLKYTRSQAHGTWSLMAAAYHGRWNSTDQIAQRAVDAGLISRSGSLDPSDGGRSERCVLQAQWRGEKDGLKDHVAAYTYYYGLDLFSNFTYFLEDPVHGDQIEQRDRRIVSGLEAGREWSHGLGGFEMTETAGLQVRNDAVWNALYHAENRTRLSTTRRDDLLETSVSPYVENRARWGPKVRSVLGLRADQFRFKDESSLAANSGARSESLLSPKASLVLGPWDKTELYLNAGFGFHSNDARGVNTTVDPKTGLPLSPATPLVRTKGAELGLRTSTAHGLQGTLAFWLLDTRSELVFDADQGASAPNRPSRRYGVEGSVLWRASPFLSLDLDAALSHARFAQDAAIGSYIPDSLVSMVSAGAALGGPGPWFGEARLRFFGPRPLIEDNSVRSRPSTLVNLRAGRSFGQDWTLALELFNLFDDRADDIDYYYASRLAGEPASSTGTHDLHFHPAEPRELRLSLARRF